MLIIGIICIISSLVLFVSTVGLRDMIQRDLESWAIDFNEYEKMIEDISMQFAELNAALEEHNKETTLTRNSHNNLVQQLQESITHQNEFLAKMFDHIRDPESYPLN